MNCNTCGIETDPETGTSICHHCARAEDEREREEEWQRAHEALAKTIWEIATGEPMRKEEK